MDISNLVLLNNESNLYMGNITLNANLPATQNIIGLHFERNYPFYELPDTLKLKLGNMSPIRFSFSMNNMQTNEVYMIGNSNRLFKENDVLHITKSENFTICSSRRGKYQRVVYVTGEMINSVPTRGKYCSFYDYSDINCMVMVKETRKNTFRLEILFTNNIGSPRIAVVRPLHVIDLNCKVENVRLATTREGCLVIEVDHGHVIHFYAKDNLGHFMRVKSQ